MPTGPRGQQRPADVAARALSKASIMTQERAIRTMFIAGGLTVAFFILREALINLEYSILGTEFLFYDGWAIAIAIGVFLFAFYRFISIRNSN